MKVRTLEEIKRILKDQRGRIFREFKAEVLGIFGSYVRGEAKPDSDLDVLVRFLPGATLFDYVGLCDFLEERLGVKVDLVPVDGMRDEIKEAILREAVYL